MHKSDLQKLKPMSLRPLGDRPLISVLTPNYNYGRFIGEAIQSVQKQTYTNWEMVICDDGSTDNSCAVVGGFANRDSRIRLIRQQNRGVASALNTAYARAEGDVIAILDADDAWFPGRLRLVLEKLQADAEVGFVTHPLRLVDATGRARLPRMPCDQLSEGFLAKGLIKGDPISLPIASGYSLRRDVAEKTFPLPTHFVSFADGVLCRRALLMTRLGALQAVLGDYRVHSRNVTGLWTYTTVGEIDTRLRMLELQVQDLAEFAERIALNIREEIGFGDREKISLSFYRAFLNGERVTWDQIKNCIDGTRRRVMWAVMCAVPRSLGIKVYLAKQAHAIEWVALSALRRQFSVRLRTVWQGLTAGTQQSGELQPRSQAREGAARHSDDSCRPHDLV